MGSSANYANISTTPLSFIHETVLWQTFMIKLWLCENIAGPVNPDYEYATSQAVENWHDLKFGLRIHWGEYVSFLLTVIKYDIYSVFDWQWTVTYIHTRVCKITKCQLHTCDMGEVQRKTSRRIIVSNFNSFCVFNVGFAIAQIQNAWSCCALHMYVWWLATWLTVIYLMAGNHRNWSRKLAVAQFQKQNIHELVLEPVQDVEPIELRSRQVDCVDANCWS